MTSFRNAAIASATISPVISSISSFIAKPAPETAVATLSEYLACAQPRPEHLDAVLGQHRDKRIPFSAGESEQTQTEDQLFVCLKAREPLLELRVDAGGSVRL